MNNVLFTGRQGRNHLQGIAVDEKNGYIYYSFTTRLVKGDLQGNIIGSVEGLVGHLGCIAFCQEDGMIYGSLEFKKDSVGAGILRSLGDAGEYADGFYAAVFNGEKITRMRMSAEKDGVMRAAFLPEVLRDYVGMGTDKTGRPVLHRYCCSGIDGLCFAPLPGDTDGKRYCWIAYGVYSDLGRQDNDHQVLCCYDPEILRAAARPLLQTAMHRQGPEKPLQKYFVFTGNTVYGVQNLEYDEKNRLLLMAVYAGKKPIYPNYDMYAADLSVPAVRMPLAGLNETGEALTLFGASGPEDAARIRGWRFPYGQCGMHFRSDGALYMAQPVKQNGENAAYIRLYAFDPQAGFRERTG